MYVINYQGERREFVWFSASNLDPDHLLMYIKEGLNRSVQLAVKNIVVSQLAGNPPSSMVLYSMCILANQSIQCSDMQNLIVVQSLIYIILKGSYVIYVAISRVPIKFYIRCIFLFKHNKASITSDQFWRNVVRNKVIHCQRQQRNGKGHIPQRHARVTG